MGPRGWDAAKRLKGRKRHILVDTFGHLLAVLVHPANIQEKAGAALLFERIAGTLRLTVCICTSRSTHFSAA